MKKLGSIILFVIAASLPLSVASVFAEASMSSWPFFVEVTSQARGAMYELIVPLQVMDKSRNDLADLRLYDVKGHEIPYALRILRDVNDKREVGARIFNQASIGSKASEISVDLGESPGEHNEVEIQTAGTNFRRRVDLEGSDSGNEWRTLKTGGVIFGFGSLNKSVESDRISYPTSRYRYLRARVFADDLTDEQAPVITAVKVTMTIHEKGYLTTWTVAVPSYQLLRNQGAPASAWTIDLGARVPCDRLTLEINDESF